MILPLPYADGFSVVYWAPALATKSAKIWIVKTGHAGDTRCNWKEPEAACAGRMPSVCSLC